MSCQRGRRAAARCGRGTPGDPHLMYVGREDIVEIRFALDAERRELSDVNRTRPEVSMFDKEPVAFPLFGRCAIAVARTDQDP